MSDEKNPDGSVDEGTAQRLAEQRKALNLQTRPLEVIADLDWDVDDDDAVFSLPTPAPTPKPAAVEPAKPVAEPAKPAVSSSGTMMMSAGDFRAALQEENAKVDEKAKAAAEVVKATATDKVQVVETEVEDVVAATAARGGTMLLSGAEMQEAMEAAKIDAVGSGAEFKATAPNEHVKEVADAAPHQSAGGTMLMSSAAIHAQLEEEADVRTAQQAIVTGDDPNPNSELASAKQGHVEPKAPQWGQAPQREEAVWGNPAELETQNRRRLPEGKNMRVLTLGAIGIVLLVIVAFLIWQGASSN